MPTLKITCNFVQRTYTGDIDEIILQVYDQYESISIGKLLYDLSFDSKNEDNVFLIDHILNNKDMSQYAKDRALTFICRVGNVSIAKRLISIGANINNTECNMRPIETAINNKKRKMVDFLYSHPLTNIHPCVNIIFSYFCTLKDELKELKKLATCSNLDINNKEYKNKPPIMHAIINDDMHIVKWLISHPKIRPNGHDIDCVIKNNNPEMIIYLLSCNTVKITKDTVRNLITYGNLDVLMYMIDKRNDILDYFSIYNALRTAIKTSHIDFVRTVLNAKRKNNRYKISVGLLIDNRLLKCDKIKRLLINAVINTPSRFHGDHPLHSIIHYDYCHNRDQTSVNNIMRLCNYNKRVIMCINKCINGLCLHAIKPSIINHYNFDIINSLINEGIDYTYTSHWLKIFLRKIFIKRMRPRLIKTPLPVDLIGDIIKYF